MPFVFLTFPNLNFFRFVFCNSLSSNVPTISLGLRSLITYVHNTVFSTFFHYKNFFRPIWIVIFCKNAFIFWYSYMLNKFRISLIILYIEVNIWAWLYTNRLHLICAMICCCIYWLYYLIYQYTHFLIMMSCIYDFYSFRLLFSDNIFPFVIWWIHFYIIILQQRFQWSIAKFATFIPLHFVGFAAWFLKKLVIVVPFLSLKGVTQIYLLVMSTTHNKNWNTLFHILIKCISASSAPQILSLKIYQHPK